MTTVACKYCRSLGAAVAVLIGPRCRLRCRPNPHCPAMGAGNAEGSKIRRRLPYYHQQRLDG